MTFIHVVVKTIPRGFWYKPIRVNNVERVILQLEQRSLEVDDLHHIQHILWTMLHNRVISIRPEKRKDMG